MTLHEKIFEENNLVPRDPPGVPRVPIPGPIHGIFSKLNGPGPLGSGGHSHTRFSNGRFWVAQRTLQYDVISDPTQFFYFSHSSVHSTRLLV